jgi:predicted transcriptional regulator
MAGTSLKQCEEALRKSGGFISHAAKLLGISTSALSQRVKKYKSLQDVREEAEEMYLDMAETELLKKIRTGSGWAICFFLKTKGKKRGYVERMEVLEDAPMPERVTIEIINGRRPEA